MFMKRSGPGSVLQGYFRVERFRSAMTPRWGLAMSAMSASAPGPEFRPASMRVGAVQPKFGPASRSVSAWSGAPRPELLPAWRRDHAVQASTGPQRTMPASPVFVAAWPHAPRPDLLPGMGPLRLGTTSMPAQARADSGVTTLPLATGQLRLIGDGRPLDARIRDRMERFFGADFSTVRVHEGPAASAIGALAFTVGEALYFAPGLYDPATRQGVELLGHELTHVVQQRDGRVRNPYGGGVAIVQDPGLEAEADEMGRRVAEQMWSGPAVGQAARGPMTRGLIQPAWTGKTWKPEDFADFKQIAKPKPKSTRELIAEQAVLYKKRAETILAKLDPYKNSMEKTVCFMWKSVDKWNYAESGFLKPEQRVAIGADPDKETICAEEVFFVKFGTSWSFSAAYDRQNGWKPACQQGSKGGCQALLAKAGVEDIYSLM